MKIKLLIVLSLAALLLLGGCRGDSNANTANANRANMNTNVATPVTKTNESATTDPTLKPKIEAALKAKGFT